MDFYDWTEIRRLASLQSEMAYYEFSTTGILAKPNRS